MGRIDEDFIKSVAPNPAAVSNGRGLAGDFIGLTRDENSTCYWGSCRGSGKNPYVVSADFINEEKPIFRCTCPSRQFPCKHALGLLYCIAEGKKFSVGQLPEDIISKRAKLTRPVTREKSVEPPKTNTAALLKKMKQQLTGLSSVRRFLDDMLKLGLASCTPKQIKQWKLFALELENFYLTGFQIEVLRLLAILSSDTAEQEKFRQAAELCGRIYSQYKKCTEFLEKKCTSDDYDYENSEVYELLGYNWKLEQLKKLGLIQENAFLIQLAFTSYQDDAAAHYTDVAFWAELHTGKIVKTKDYIPFKAMKYIKRTDCEFSKRNAAELCFYPSGQRARWESAQLADIEPGDIAKIAGFACDDCVQAVKDAKNRLKSPLTEGYVPALLHYSKLCNCKNGYALVATDGTVLSLCDYREFGRATDTLTVLNRETYLLNQAMFGVFHMSDPDSIAFMPLAIVTDDEILRLQF